MIWRDSFFEVTSKLSSIEVILILKIVSDGLVLIYPKSIDKISTLIEIKIPTLLDYCRCFISKNLKDQILLPKNFEDKDEKLLSQRVTSKKLHQ